MTGPAVAEPQLWLASHAVARYHRRAPGAAGSVTRIAPPASGATAAKVAPSDDPSRWTDVTGARSAPASVASLTATDTATPPAVGEAITAGTGGVTS